MIISVFVILTDQRLILNKIWKMIKLFTTVVNCNVQSVKLFLCLFCFRRSGNSELQPWNPYLKAKEPKIEKQSFIVLIETNLYVLLDFSLRKY